jgi:hypothetical protein
MDAFSRNESHLRSTATNSDRLHFHTHPYVTRKMSTNYGANLNSFVGNKTRSKTGYEKARNFIPTNRNNIFTTLFSNKKDTFQ